MQTLVLLRPGFAVERAADTRCGLELQILSPESAVGAGINVEHAFSTVNNKSYGCGSKVTHNLVGLFGVM